MIVMVIEISDFLSRVEATQYTIFTQKFHSSVAKTLKKYNGKTHKRDNNNYWVSFKVVDDAVHCALEIQHKFKYVTPKHQSFSRRLQVALTISNSLQEADFISTSILCEMTKHQVVITTSVKDLFENYNEHALIDETLIYTLEPSEKTFLLEIEAYLRNNYKDVKLSVHALGDALGLSYAQLYRKLHKLAGKTPLTFIKDYKLHKALDLLYHKKFNITDVAKQTGFSSLAYFSNCFFRKYGVRPSIYLKQHV